jgi:hypothetical protein
VSVADQSVDIRNAAAPFPLLLLTGSRVLRKIEDQALPFFSKISNPPLCSIPDGHLPYYHMVFKDFPYCSVSP